MRRVEPGMRQRVHQRRRYRRRIRRRHRHHQQRPILKRLPRMVQNIQRPQRTLSNPLLHQRLVSAPPSHHNEPAHRPAPSPPQSTPPPPPSSAHHRHKQTRHTKPQRPRCKLHRSNPRSTRRRNILILTHRHQWLHPPAEICQLRRLSHILHRQPQTNRRLTLPQLRLPHRLKQLRPIPQKNRRRSHRIPQHIPKPAQPRPLR